MKPFFTFIFLTFLLQAFPQTDQIMFPGDMNNDGVANHYDILPLGLAIFDEGFPRELQGIHWMEHPFLTWDQVLPVTGINFGFIDSDGNGKIDTLDMDAILLNYDSVQNTSIPEPKPYIPQDTCFTCPAPTLALRFLQDTAWINEAFFAEIVYEYDDGIEVPEELGTMGFAFDLEYNPAWVKDGMTMVTNDFPGSEDFMMIAATSTDVETWRFPPPGRIGMGASGRRKNVFSFPRPVASVGFIVEDMIIRNDPVTVGFSPVFSNVLMINNLEQQIIPNTFSDVIILADPNTSIKKVDDWEKDIKVFPNPAKEYIRIQSAKEQINRIEVFSIQGQLILSKELDKVNYHEVSTHSLANGIYYLKTYTNSGISTKKLEVIGN